VRRLAEWCCLAIYAVAPLAALGSLVFFMLISDAGLLARFVVGSLAFFGFGFLGMFARGLAQQLRDERRQR